MLIVGDGRYYNCGKLNFKRVLQACVILQLSETPLQASGDRIHHEHLHKMPSYQVSPKSIEWLRSSCASKYMDEGGNEWTRKFTTLLFAGVYQGLIMK